MARHHAQGIEQRVVGMQGNESVAGQLSHRRGGRQPQQIELFVKISLGEHPGSGIPADEQRRDVLGPHNRGRVLQGGFGSDENWGMKIRGADRRHQRRRRFATFVHVDDLIEPPRQYLAIVLPDRRVAMHQHHEGAGGHAKAAARRAGDERVLAPAFDERAWRKRIARGMAADNSGVVQFLHQPVDDHVQVIGCPESFQDGFAGRERAGRADRDHIGKPVRVQPIEWLQGLDERRFVGWAHVGPNTNSR